MTLHGFRCASCFRKWIMLVSDKDRAFAIGIKSGSRKRKLRCETNVDFVDVFAPMG